MTAASSSAREIALERPQIELVRGAEQTILLLRGAFCTTGAWLDDRRRRLVAASIRHVIDARTIGGLTVTVDLDDPFVAVAPRRAAALMITTAGAHVVLALLGREDVVLAAVRLDQAAIELLQGEPR